MDLSRFRNRRGARAGSGPVHPVDEVLAPGPMVLYGLQHVLTMYAGVVAVPLIIGTALELTPQQITYLLSAGLFISGVATLLQTLGLWRLGARLPIVQGTSFAAVATMLAIGTSRGGVDGLRAIFGALIVAGAIGLAIALAMGVIPIAVPEFYEDFPTWFQVIFESGISAAAMTAIVLNLLFNFRQGELEEGPIFAEAPPIGTTFEGDTEGIVTEDDPPHPTRPIHPRPDAH